MVALSFINAKSPEASFSSGFSLLDFSLKVGVSSYASNPK
nr:MAG TPA: hypothetical protein [Caudoviricetes sp.]